MEEASIDYGKVKAFYNGRVYELVDPAKLRAAREACMFRQTDVARKLSLKRVQQYAYWESTARNPSSKAIPKDKFDEICTLLRVKASDLRPSA